jgi:hypothetical protein
MVAFTFALGIHVIDEATHDFLSFYNPRVQPRESLTSEK